MPVIIYPRYLDIDGVPMATPAWKIRDLTPLIDGPEFRGQNRIIAGVAGRKAVKRNVEEKHVALELIVRGDRDQNNAVQSDVRAGLEANIAYLVTNVGAQPATADGTRTLTLHQQGGGTKSGTAHVTLKLAGQTQGSARGTLDIVIPSGGLL